MIDLQKKTREGAAASALIECIKATEATEVNAFLVIRYFMEALDLTLLQVRELPGAFSLGGGVYTDQEIDALIGPHLLASLEPKK